MVFAKTFTAIAYPLTPYQSLYDTFISFKTSRRACLPRTGRNCTKPKYYLLQYSTHNWDLEENKR